MHKKTCTAIVETLSLAFESAPFVICALSLDQKILLWNRTAERIMGLSPDEVLGRRCNDLKRGSGPGSLTPECQEGCPSIRYLRSGLIPPPTRLQMLCASGGYKWVSAVPMVVAGALNGSPILIHLFEDAARRRVSVAEPKASRDIPWRWIEPTCPTAILNRISPPMMFPICLAGRGKSCIWWRRDGKLRGSLPGWESASTPFETTSGTCGTSLVRTASSMRWSRDCAWCSYPWKGRLNHYLP